MLTILAAATTVFFLIITCVLLLYSPGTLKPHLDTNSKAIPGSIAEKIFITVGNIRQGMFITGRNIDNPVLLYVHGGPAFPNYFLIDKFNPGLENYFTVCYWEQRGGGLSYSSKVTLQSMTFDQFASDAIDVTNYLRKRFGKEKIFIMAHSGGTPIALLAVSRNPKLYLAYIAMAQITNQAESEIIAYQYMLDQYSNTGNHSRINQLKQHRVLESDSNIISFYKSLVRDRSMHELGIGTMHKMQSVFRDIFLPVWTCKAYTIREKINIWKSKFFFMPKTNLINELIKTDFASMVPKLDIPIYFFSGKYDLTVNVGLSKEYFMKLDAPLKGFYTFDNSAHSPLFEEPLLVRSIIEKDVLNNKNTLQDR